jgi:SnoaL-like domain
MSRQAGVCCPNCGHSIAPSSIWAINRTCSECLQPLGLAAEQMDLEGRAVGVDGEATVRCWFDAFNARDLDPMLACMHAQVDFHPLRLHGLDSSYHGHDGVRAWFDQLVQLEHRHRVELDEVRAGNDGQLIAIGTLSVADPSGPSSFWALENFAEGTISAAHHYLTDPKILNEGGLQI